MTHPYDPLPDIVQAHVHHEHGMPRSISHQGLLLFAKIQQCSLRKAMCVCLEQGLWPLRFVRSCGTFTAFQQQTLLQSTAAIIGCGALGGHVAMQLARLGVGELVLCDPDIFEESNLNRQPFCHEQALGQAKVQVTAQALKQVASHMDIRTEVVAASPDTLPGLLNGVGVAIDCLDSLQTRHDVEVCSLAAGIPFVHGSIAGTEGFAALSLPGGKPIIRHLYDTETLPIGVEKKAGLPASTPALVACYEAWIAAQVLIAPDYEVLGSLSCHLVHADLSTLQTELFSL